MKTKKQETIAQSCSLLFFKFCSKNFTFSMLQKFCNNEFYCYICSVNNQ